MRYVLADGQAWAVVAIIVVAMMVRYFIVAPVDIIILSNPGPSQPLFFWAKIWSTR